MSTMKHSMYAYLYVFILGFSCLPILGEIVDHTDPSFRRAVLK